MPGASSTPCRCFSRSPAHRSSPSVCIGASGATPRSAISSAIVKASTWVILVFVVIELVAEGTTAVPRAVWVIQWLVLVVLLCGTRLAYRFAKTAARRARARCPASAGDARSARAAVRRGPLACPVRRRGPLDARDQHAGSRHHRGCGHAARALRARRSGAWRPQDLDRIVAELAVQGIHPQRLVMTRPAERLPPEVRTFAERCRARYGLELHFLPDMLGVPAGVSATRRRDRRESCERAYFRVRRPVEVSLCALRPCSCSCRCSPDRARRARRPGPSDPVPPGAPGPGQCARSRSTSFAPCAVPATRHGAAAPGLRADLAGRPRAAPHAARRAAAARATCCGATCRSSARVRCCAARSAGLGGRAHRDPARHHRLGPGQRRPAVEREEKIALDAWYVRNAGPLPGPAHCRPHVEDDGPWRASSSGSKSEPTPAGESRVPAPPGGEPLLPSRHQRHQPAAHRSGRRARHARLRDHRVRRPPQAISTPAPSCPRGPGALGRGAPSARIPASAASRCRDARWTARPSWRARSSRYSSAPGRAT